MLKKRQVNSPGHGLFIFLLKTNIFEERLLAKKCILESDSE